MISAPSVVRGSLVVLALLGGAACSSSGDTSASTTSASTTEGSATEGSVTEGSVTETTANDASTGPGAGDQDSSSPSAAELEAMLPDASEMGDGFVEVPVNPTAEPLRRAMADECPDAAMVTETIDGTVGRAFEAEDGTRLTVELVAGVEPLSEAEESELLDALNGCHIVIEQGGVTHSLRFSAGSEDLGDQGVRGALTDSMSSAEVVEPIGVNTYFVRVVVGDVAILVRGADSFDGVERQQLATSDLMELAGEVIARVEALVEG